MAENLKTTRFNNGEEIYECISDEDWTNYGGATWCYSSYNNDIYGKVYNFHVVDIVGNNICPIGCHVNTWADWETLINYSGRYSIAGGKLKETGTIHCTTPNTGATNETGFTALPGGYRSPYGLPAFHGIGFVGYCWSSTETTEITWAYSQGMDYTSSYLTTYSWWFNKQMVFLFVA
jgi:uncharacterized protein (TIGR02145 family)